MTETTVCKVPANTAWQAYDRFNAEGQMRPNGQIDDLDVLDWVVSVSDNGRLLFGDSRFPTPHKAYCGIFRLEMIYQKFLAEVVTPESVRTTPLSRHEIEIAKVTAAQKIEATKDLLKAEYKAASDEDIPDCSWYSLGDACSTSGRDHAVLMQEIALEMGFKLVLQALEQSYTASTGRLYQIGIGFGKEKKIGQFVVIDDLNPERADNLREKGLQPGATITAIDGCDTRYMTWNDVWLALKGLKDTTAELTVQDPPVWNSLFPDFDGLQQYYVTAPTKTVVVSRERLPWVMR